MNIDKKLMALLEKQSEVNELNNEKFETILEINKALREISNVQERQILNLQKDLRDLKHFTVILGIGVVWSIVWIALKGF